MTIFLWILIAFTVLFVVGYVFAAVKFQGKKKILNRRTHIIVGVAALLIVVSSLLGIKTIRDTISSSNTDTYLALLALEESREDVAVPHLYEAVGKGGVYVSKYLCLRIALYFKSEMPHRQLNIWMLWSSKRSSPKKIQQVIQEIWGIGRELIIRDRRASVRFQKCCNSNKENTGNYCKRCSALRRVL